MSRSSSDTRYVPPGARTKNRWSCSGESCCATVSAYTPWRAMSTAPGSTSVAKMLTDGQAAWRSANCPKQHRQGVRLFPAGASGDPDAYRVGAVSLAAKRRHDLLPKRVEDLAVTEEARHANQQVLLKRQCLRGVGLQQLDVLVGRRALPRLDSLLQPANQGPLLVRREIVPGSLQHELADARQLRLQRFARENRLAIRRQRAGT